MQRRQLLKWIMPIALVATGAAVGRKVLMKTQCGALGLVSLLKHLKPFSDAELGKKISLPISADDLKRFDGLCEENFDEGFRQLVTKDFGAGKVKVIDGWILSETETVTHQLVYQSVQQSH